MTYKRTLEVDCRGRLAHVEVRGDGDDVILVGGATPMDLTRATAENLATRGFRVTDFDYGSGHADPEPRTMLDQVADVVTVMDTVGLVAPCVVGISRAAMAAYALAARQPDRVESLILALPVSGHEDTLGLPVDEPDTTDGLLSYVFSPDYLAHSRDVGIELFGIPPGAVTRVARLEETPFDEDMRVVCPTLVVEAAADQVVSSAHPQRYLTAIDGAKHILVAGAQHGWPIEQPAEFGRLISEFVAG